MNDQDAARAAGSSAPACCVCGCEFFVWWIRDQGRFSSETPWEYYDRQRHPQAQCLDCARPCERCRPTVEGSRERGDRLKRELAAALVELREQHKEWMDLQAVCDRYSAERKAALAERDALRAALVEVIEHVGYVEGLENVPARWRKAAGE